MPQLFEDFLNGTPPEALTVYGSYANNNGSARIVTVSTSTGVEPASGGEVCVRRTDLGVVNDDQWIEFLIPNTVTSDGSSVYGGGAIRIDTGGVATYSACYANSDGNIFVFDVINGTANTPHKNVAAQAPPGSLVRFGVTNNVIYIDIDGVNVPSLSGDTLDVGIGSGTLGFAGYGTGSTNMHIDVLRGGHEGAAGSEIVSAGSGDFNTGTTWVGGVAPTVDDDIIIASGHAVTGCSGNLGSFGTVGTGNAIEVQGTGSLTITGNLTLKGGLNIPSSGSITVSPGVTITTDTAASQVWNLASTGLLHFNGASGNRCTVDKAALTANHNIVGTLGGKLRANYTDVSNMGSATTSWFKHTAINDNNEYTFTNSTTTSCGNIDLQHSLAATIEAWEIDVYTPLNVEPTPDIFLQGTGPTNRTNDANIHHYRLHRPESDSGDSLGIMVWAVGFNIHDCVLGGAGISCDISADYGDIHRNIGMRSVENGSGITPGSRDNIHIYDNYIRGFSWCYTSAVSAVTNREVYGNIFEGTATANTHQACDPSAPGEVIRHNIIIGQNNVSNILGFGQLGKLQHNTIVVDIESANAVRGNYQATSQTNGDVRSNILLGNMTALFSAVIDEGNTLDSFTYLDYNCIFNVGTGSTDAYVNITMTGKTEGVTLGFAANDVYEDPQLVDHTFRSSITLAEFLAGTSTIDTVLAEYRTNYAPQNTNLTNAGDDATTIGALEVAAAVTLSGSLQADPATVFGTLNVVNTAITLSGSLQTEASSISGALVDDPVSLIESTILTTAGEFGGSVQAGNSTVSGNITDISPTITLTGSLQTDPSTVSGQLNVTIPVSPLTIPSINMGDVIIVNTVNMEVKL